VSAAWRIAAASTFLLLALQWIPPLGPAGAQARPWLLPALLSLPLLFPALLFVLRRHRAPLWAGIAALFYFCLGIADLRVSGSPRHALEVALSVVVVFAAGWPGLAAKLAKRRATTPPNV
jgi:uncharacterized membrane protein